MKGEQKLVKVAQAATAEPGEVLVALGLGSCVAILLHDPVRRVAGMAHVFLPHPSNGKAAGGGPAKFASTAVPHLVEQMRQRGADSKRLVARLVGGASMFGSLLAQGTTHVGERNLTEARLALRQAGIPIVAEEVGKEHGRSVRFFPEDGRALVRSLAHGEVEL